MNVEAKPSQNFDGIHFQTWTLLNNPVSDPRAKKSLANRFVACQSVSRLKLVSEEQQTEGGHTALLPCSASYKH